MVKGCYKGLLAAASSPSLVQIRIGPLIQGVTVGILLQNPLEERRAGSQDHLVGLNLIVTAGKSDISKVILFLTVAEGIADVRFKIISPKTKFRRTHDPELSFEAFHSRT